SAGSNRMGREGRVASSRLAMGLSCGAAASPVPRASGRRRKERVDMAKIARSISLAALGFTALMPVAAAAQYGQPNPAPPQAMPGRGQNENPRSQAAPAAAEPAAAS